MATDRIGVSILHYNFTQEQLDFLCGDGKWSGAPMQTNDEHKKPSPLLVWAFGLFFVTAISLCALVGILVMRFLKKKVFNRFITFFVAVGVGSLSGSAVFHLLPQSFGLVNELDPHANHDYLYKAFAAVIGIYLFFFCDKAIKITLETKKRRKQEANELPALPKPNDGVNNTNEISADDHSGRSHEALIWSKMDHHKHDHKHTSPNNVFAQSHEDENDGINRQKRQRTISKNSSYLPVGYEDEDDLLNRQAHSICVHDHDLEYKPGDSVIATVAWMIIFGDGLHNFIDGVSIGASFSESILSGISVSVAVICEEFPHELGDVAILVSAGMTLRQALVYNLLSALTCYIGFFIGVVVGNLDYLYTSYTFGFAGGMFLYIALACMMPEMKIAMEEGLNISLKAGLEVIFLQTIGLVVGLTLMLCMARYGGEISFGSFS